MNRFRKNKKGKEGVEELEQNNSSGFFKWKRTNTEAKADFDLAAALPSQDDFRTSLIMPNLSARFSMLREQDDPNTKVGKANDDSVLFPKRASRLNLFNHQHIGLSDIAEVSSIDGRPSLALTRPGSQISGEGYGTDDDPSAGGSVMSRKRPGEGNNLFGGRQKVYKIPMGGPSDGQGSKGMRGRAVYDDDVTMSAFQRYRQEEKGERLAELVINAQETHQNDVEERGHFSPTFSALRTASSSTTSGQSMRRTSTAATSVDEQINGSTGQRSPDGATLTPSSPIKPTPTLNAATKPRRLYGQGLAQAVHDQQSSAMNRLENLNRQRAGAGPQEVPRLNRGFSRSATNLHDRVQRFAPVHAMPPVYRGPSPPGSSKSMVAPAEEAVKESSPSPLTSPPFNSLSTLSPSISDAEDAATLVAALEPEDRGKATAMGLFNRPIRSYDEQQYSKRQLQMHEDRNTPPVRRGQNYESEDNNSTRPRGLSITTSRYHAETGSSRHSEDESASLKGVAASRYRETPNRPTQGTFFIGSESEGEADDSPSLRRPTFQRPSQPPEGIHPAFRSRPGSTDSDMPSIISQASDTPEIKTSEARDLNTIDEAPPSPVSPIDEEESLEQALDSPTLGPSGLGLSGLVRAHLRQESVNSVADHAPSMNGAPSLDIVSPISELSDNSGESHPLARIHSNPWEYDDQNASRSALPQLSAKPLDRTNEAASVMSIRARQMLERAAALRDQQNAARSEPVVDGPQATPSAEWQAEVKFTHRRDGSTETQKEREDFANELAERRRKVQEKLKSFHEAESRSSSPNTGRNTPDIMPSKAGSGGTFSMLKNRSVKHVPVSHADMGTSTKSAKPYILGANNMNASSTSLVEKRVDDHVLGKLSNSSSPHLAGNPNSRSGLPALRSPNNGSREDLHTPSSSRDVSPHAANSAASQRDRSVSVSSRSKSRTQHRDDLWMVEEAPADVHGPQSTGDDSTPRQAPSIPSSARPSVEVDERTIYSRSSSSLGGRFRSGSRSAATPPHLDLPLPEMTVMGASPRASPVTPYSANATPPLFGTDGESLASSPNLMVAFNAHGQPFPQRFPGSVGVSKRVVDKSQISEPTLLSCTSNVPTVDLPPGASLSNGINTPPVPPMNPRRRRGTIAAQTIIGAFKADKPNSPTYIQPGTPSPAEERRMFVDDENSFRQRPREMSNESGAMSIRARQQALMAAASRSSPHTPIAYNTHIAVPDGMI